MLIQNGYEWMTHQPAIKGVMELYSPKYVLELGVGVYSTPVFISYGIDYHAVESNHDWIDEIRQRYGIEPIYHEGIDERTNFSKTDTAQREKICKFYQDIEIKGDHPRLLFVDQAPSCRVISINTLKRHFDLILFHDCDKVGIEDNSYDLISREGFDCYVLNSPMTGTGIMIREDIDRGIDVLDNAIAPYVYYFKKEHPQCTYMRLHGMVTR